MKKLSSEDMVKCLKMQTKFLSTLNRYQNLLMKGLHKASFQHPDLEYMSGYVQVHSFVRHLERTGQLDAKIKEIKDELITTFRR